MFIVAQQIRRSKYHELTPQREDLCPTTAPINLVLNGLNMMSQILLIVTI